MEIDLRTRGGFEGSFGMCMIFTIIFSNLPMITWFSQHKINSYVAGLRIPNSDSLI